jgi:hypothetical protein
VNNFTVCQLRKRAQNLRALARELDEKANRLERSRDKIKTKGHTAVVCPPTKKNGRPVWDSPEQEAKYLLKKLGLIA